MAHFSYAVAITMLGLSGATAYGIVSQANRVSSIRLKLSQFSINIEFQPPRVVLQNHSDLRNLLVESSNNLFAALQSIDSCSAKVTAAKHYETKKLQDIITSVLQDVLKDETRMNGHSLQLNVNYVGPSAFLLMEDNFSSRERGPTLLGFANGSTCHGNGHGHGHGAGTVTGLVSSIPRPLTSNNLFMFNLGDSASEGISVKGAGHGQMSGVVFTVPAHGKITVDFKIRIQCLTPDNVKNIDAVNKSVMDLSHQKQYEELEQTSASASWSFWSGGSASASYSDTKHTMEKWGLKPEDMTTIVNNIASMENTWNEFNYSGTIDNSAYDYEVSGNLFGFVMDCEITANHKTNQVRMIGNKVELKGDTGDNLPVVGKLY